MIFIIFSFVLDMRAVLAFATLAAATGFAVSPPCSSPLERPPSRSMISLVASAKSTIPPFLSLSVAELSEQIGGSGRAKAVWEALRNGDDPRLLPDSGKAVSDFLLSRDVTPSTVQLVSGSEDGTTKLLVKLRDGLQVETVLIPVRKRSPSDAGGTTRKPTTERTTLCVSSQVGCDRGCQFCATGTMGLVRNLSADEILSQMIHGVRVARESGLPPIGNVVFMGQGEAGRNAEAVVAAATALTDQNRFGLARQKVTISTVGVDAASLNTLARAPAMLAWSVHAADAELRRRLVPTSRAHSPEELRDALAGALSTRPEKARTLMIAVTLLAGINDSPAHAQQLAEFLRPLLTVVKKIAVDLIPYNPHDGAPVEFERPADERVYAFLQQIRAAFEGSTAMGYGVYVSVRVPRGDEKMAACGQLVTSRQAVVDSVAEVME